MKVSYTFYILEVFIACNVISGNLIFRVLFLRRDCWIQNTISQQLWLDVESKGSYLPPDAVDIVCNGALNTVADGGKRATDPRRHPYPLLKPTAI